MNIHSLWLLGPEGVERGLSGPPWNANIFFYSAGKWKEKRFPKIHHKIFRSPAYFARLQPTPNYAEVQNPFRRSQSSCHIVIFCILQLHRNTDLLTLRTRTKSLLKTTSYVLFFWEPPLKSAETALLHNHSLYMRVWLRAWYGVQCVQFMFCRKSEP